MVGPERDWKLWNSCESGEVPHEFFECYGRFGQRRTGDPGRQGGGEMELNKAWHPLPGTGRPWSGEESGLGGAPGWDTGEPAAGGTPGAHVDRKGGAALVAASPRHAF